MSTYYYLRHDGKTLGGPYATIGKLAAGVRRAEKRGHSRSVVLPQRLVDGQWFDLSSNETSALLATVDEGGSSRSSSKSSFSRWALRDAKAKVKTARAGERMALHAIVENLAAWSRSVKRQGFASSDTKGQVARDIERLVDAYREAADRVAARERELVESKRR